MKKYIDAVKAELERRQKIHYESADPFAAGQFAEDTEVLSFIDSLQLEQLVNKNLSMRIACDIIEMTAKRAIDKPQDKDKEVELMTRKINYLRLLEGNDTQQGQQEITKKNMTPEQYQDACVALRDEKRKLVDQLERLEEQGKALKENYIKEVFDASPFHIGDKITDEEGRTWFVSGADEVCNRIILRLNPPKKNGTMSGVTYVGRGEPDIYLN